MVLFCTDSSSSTSSSSSSSAGSGDMGGGAFRKNPRTDTIAFTQSACVSVTARSASLLTRIICVIASSAKRRSLAGAADVARSVGKLTASPAAFRSSRDSPVTSTVTT